MPDYNGIPVPADGVPIRVSEGSRIVSDSPIVPFIEGDGSGRDIWKASRAVVRCRRRESIRRLQAHRFGTRCLPERRRTTASASGCPADTLDAIREFKVAIKGPLTTPVGGGIRSINVALRQNPDFVFLRPPGEVVPGRALAHEESGRSRCGDFPREHRGRLCGNRVGARHPRSCPDHRIPQRSDGTGYPVRFRYRNQASFGRRVQSGW